MTYDELVAEYGDDLFVLVLLYGSGDYWQGLLWLETGSNEGDVVSRGSQGGQTSAATFIDPTPDADWLADA